MTKHTPGPWQYAFEGGTTAFITESDGSTIFCLRTTENTTAHKGLAANARLIAAAPELLEALLVMLRDYMAVHGDGDLEMQPAIYQAQKAIAKATGDAE